MPHIIFDDGNQAHIKYLGSYVQTFSAAEIKVFKKHMKKLPLNKYKIIKERNYGSYGHIWIKFDDPAEEAYFKILTADGIEI
jgi:hypothetical protein